MIDIKNISYKYKYADYFAINNVSFSIKEDSKIAIWGNKASGKTTLLKLLSGLLFADSGEILLNNKPINKPNAQSNVQLIFSDGGFFKYKSFKSNIVYGLRKNNRQKDEISKLINSPYNEDAFSSYNTPGFLLDNNEIVIMNMERVFHRKAEILLIDNIFDLLGIEERSIMFSKYIDLIKNLDSTVIFATNSLDEALSVGDVVYFLDSGEIVSEIHKCDMNKIDNYLMFKEMHPYRNEIEFVFNGEYYLGTYTLKVLYSNEKNGIDYGYLSFYKNNYVYFTPNGYYLSTSLINCSDNFAVDEIKVFSSVTNQLVNSVKINEFFKNEIIPKHSFNI